MSVYLTIKKNGSEICSFNTNAGIGQFLTESCPYISNEWTEVNFEAMFDTFRIEYEEEKKNIQKRLDANTLLLNTKLSLEDMTQVCGEIQDDKQDLMELEDTWSQFCMLYNICNYKIWDEENKSLVNKIEWKYE